MRVGKFVEHFRAAAEASDAKGTDPVLKYCAVGRQLGYAGYLLLDNLTVVCPLLKFFQRIKIADNLCDGSSTLSAHASLLLLPVSNEKPTNRGFLA